MMDEDAIIYLTFSIVIILITMATLGSYGGGLYSLIALFLTIMTLIIIVLIHFADFLVFPLLTSILGITFQPAKGYKIVKEQDSIVKEVNGLFYSTGYVTGNLFAYSFKAETTQQDEDLRILQAPENWERAVMSIEFPFKFHVISVGSNVQQVRDELEGKRSYQEFQLSRAMQSQTANEMSITDLQRKINVLQTKIDRISQGERPVSTLIYIETTAVGISEKASLDALASQIKQLQIAFGSFDLELGRIAGRELYILFKFNFSLPTSIEEVTGQFDQQS